MAYLIDSSRDSVSGLIDSDAAEAALPPLDDSLNAATTGTPGNDVMNGTAMDDTMDGLAGNDTLYGLGGNDQLNGGDGDDRLVGGEGADALDGGNGEDLAIYTASDAAVTINLDTGGATGGHATGDTLIGIENILGSTFGDRLTGDGVGNLLSGFGGNDVLTGLAGNDRLFGGDGNDQLDGGEGADFMNGGAGRDFAVYRSATSGVDVHLGMGGTRGEATGDRYTDIEGVVGSTFADSLIGDAGDNVLFGLEGNDQLEGGIGADDLVGGDGRDFAVYRNATEGVTVNLAGVGSGGEATGDTYTDIEGVVGSTFADSITGDASNNTLFGLDGNDQMEGGLGADQLIGGDGRDFAVYRNAADGVIVNLAGMGSGGEATGDSYTSIEGVVGSAFADSITGDAGDNILFGMDGNDQLEGGAGADALVGGDGRDFAVYSNAAAGVEFDLGSGVGTGGDAAGDTYNSIEGAVGSGFDDIMSAADTGGTLFGLAGADTLVGGAARDVLIGGDGNDSLSGGEGNDVLRGGDGDDMLFASTGSDFMLGGAGADTFVVSSSDTGRTLVRDFTLADGDVVNLTGFGPDFDTFAEVEAAARDAGGTVVIDLNGVRLQLFDMTVADLDAGMFEFDAPLA